MTATPAKNNDVQIAIAVSVVIHLLLLSLAVWEMGRGLAARLASPPVQPDVEEEVTLVYAEMILPPPEPPKEEPKTFIRTSQNTTAEAPPLKADFVSDRNTIAASEKAPDPEGDMPLPTQEGIDKPMLELADRDYKDGEIKEDGATPVPMTAPASPTTAALDPVRVPKPAPPPSPPPPPAPAPPPPPAPVLEMAKAEPVTPLEAMMKERDESDAARLSLDRLPLEVRKGEAPEPPAMREVEPPLPAVPPAQEPPPPLEMRAPSADAVPRAVPVPDPVSKTAGPADPDSFSPFTRTSKVKGTLSNRGEAAVNAAETPVGRYMRQVTGAVEKKWHRLRRTNADAVTFGSLKLRFYVLPDGSVLPPNLLSNPKDADARMVDFTLRAVMEAEIPPIPEDLLPLLEGRRLEVEYDVLIY